MIKVLFFAQVRELTGTSTLEVGADYPDVAALRSALAERDDRWRWRWSQVNCWRQ